jgi:tRNA pseudouridine38-40 synthase
MTISYDGGPWQGWQSQPGHVGVQDQLELALGRILQGPVSVQGSGRTDAGVHALAQVAHAEVPEQLSHLQPEHWQKAMNALLPRSIRVMQCAYAAPRFHARYDAVAKTYLYRIHRGAVLPPLEAGRAWHIFGPLDLELMQAAAQCLTGRHNFYRFSANRGDLTAAQLQHPNPEATTRTVHSILLEQRDALLELRFRGEGFLYKMVRLMLGAIVQVARGREELSWLQQLLAEPSGQKNHHCAPACGLYLEQVEYEEKADASR